MNGENEVKVVFQPQGRKVYVLSGTSLLEAAGRAGIIIQTPCGGQGTCGKCKVKVHSGSCEIKNRQEEGLTGEQFNEGYRLACQTVVQSDAVIEIPREATFENEQQILTDYSEHDEHVEAIINKKYFELPPPSQDDPRSDVSRLTKEIGDGTVVPHHIKKFLPRFLRKNDWKGTAVLAENRTIALEKGDTSARKFGVAFDIGTTTVVGTLFDLHTGNELASSARMNPQVAYGDDVISRIHAIREKHELLQDLQREIVHAMNDIIHALADDADISRETVYEVVVVGNSTMQQLICGYDPGALGEVPFVQVFDKTQILPAAEVGLSVNPGAELCVFPQIGGFVGGDTVAGMLASRLDRWEEPVILVDIGTNGEMVLAHDNQLLATSTAAGPALEGARIAYGMRAAAGAIEKVILRDDVRLNVIGNTKPAGICGTALIDTVAEMLRKGLIDETGRIVSAENAPDEIPEALTQRLHKMENGRVDFLLVAGDKAANGENIYLRQKDVRELQLVTGAIRAGVNLLIKRAGLNLEDLGAVLLAGAFGNFIRRSNARRVGLLPQVACNRIRFIGNAASLGAKMVLLSARERRYASELRDKAEHVDLSLDKEFQMEFGEAMMFPAEEVDYCADE